MADNSEGFEPRVYEKGDRVRVAHSPSEAVALEFDGYKRQAAPETPGGEEPGGEELETPVVDTPITPTPAVVAKAQKKDNA